MNRSDKSLYSRSANKEENDVLLAWNKVADAMQNIGSYRSIVFDDALIHRVLLDMGGWIKYGQVLKNELPFFKRTFERRYRFYLQQKPLWHPRQLMGLIELTNTLQGYFFPPPVFYGDKQLALKVYQQGKALSDEQLLSLAQEMEHLKHIIYLKNHETFSQEKQHDSKNFNKDEKDKSISKN